MFDRGISYEGDLLDLADTANVVENSGAWYSYRQTRLGQGREASKNFLCENKDHAQEIREAVLNNRAAIAERQSSSAKGEPTDGGARKD
jgi:recombination protein RecA